MTKSVRKIIVAILVGTFIGTSIQLPAYAQIDPMPFMPAPGVMVHLSPEYIPAYLKGIVIHPKDPFKFDFIIYKGDKLLTYAQKKQEYTKLTKYFMASLAIPDDDQWVNLSPYEKNRIIKDDFGKTEMGRDLLAQDYLLKQITASLIYPESQIGKEFWKKVYAQAQKQYGTTNIPVNTFNKVWILPDDALIYEKGNTAYVLKNHLRVMLEEDYLSLQKHSGINTGVIVSVEDAKQSHSLASNIIRQIVLPELQKEVNEDANFAPLRQVYSGMLLATWFKRTLKQSLLGQIYANKAKVKGVDQDPRTNEEIYRQYLAAYKKGVFNFIKEDTDRLTNETIPRKYFSGGTVGYDHAQIGVTHQIDFAQRAGMQSALFSADFVNVVLSAIRPKIRALYKKIAQYPRWDWEYAHMVSVEESTHDGQLPTEENYLKNLQEVRIDFLSLLGRIEQGEHISLNDFILAYRQMNRLLLTGRDGRSFYFPPSMLGHIKSKIEGVAGQFRNDEYAARKLKSMLNNLRQFFSPSWIKKRSLKDVVLHIIDFYVFFIKAPSTSYPSYLLFKYGNNSMAMNMVNAMLRLYHLNGISHDNLDSQLLESAGLRPQHFLDRFLENIYRTNPGVDFQRNAFKFLKEEAESNKLDVAMGARKEDGAMKTGISVQRDVLKPGYNPEREEQSRIEINAMSLLEYAEWVTFHRIQVFHPKLAHEITFKDIWDQLLRRPMFRGQEIILGKAAVKKALEHRKLIAAVLGYSSTFFNRPKNKAKTWMEKSYGNYQDERLQNGLRYEGHISFRNWQRDFTPEKMSELNLRLSKVLAANNGRLLLKTLSPIRANAESIFLHWDDIVLFSDRQKDVQVALDLAREIFGPERVLEAMAAGNQKSFMETFTSKVQESIRSGRKFNIEDLPEMLRSPQILNSFGFIMSGDKPTQEERSAEVRLAIKRLNEGAYENADQLKDMKEKILRQYPFGLTTDQDLQDALLILLTFPSDLDRDSERYYGQNFIESIKHWVTMYLIDHFESQVLPAIEPGKYLGPHAAEKRLIMLDRLVLLPRLIPLINENDLLQTISPNSLAWLNAHMPMIVKPFSNLQDIIDLQKAVGDSELHFGVIEHDGDGPVIYLSNDHSDYAQPRFEMITEGHTHGFSLSSPSQADNLRAWLGDMPSFILGFNKESNAVNLAYYLPSEKKWNYIRGDNSKEQQEIGQILKKFGLIKDFAMVTEPAKKRSEDLGGIDLNSANLNLYIKRDGNGVPLSLLQQDLAQFSNIQGLDPIILSIKPASQTALFSQLIGSP